MPIWITNDPIGRTVILANDRLYLDAAGRNRTILNSLSVLNEEM